MIGLCIFWFDLFMVGEGVDVRELLKFLFFINFVEGNLLARSDDEDLLFNVFISLVNFCLGL